MQQCETAPKCNRECVWFMAVSPIGVQKLGQNFPHDALLTGHLLRNCWNVFTTNSFDVLSTGGFGFFDFAGARFCAAALAA